MATNNVNLRKKDIVKSKIVEAIRINGYSKGDKMAGENDLAAKFGVSRPTIRSALRELSEEGKIIKKQGSGTFVGILGSEAVRSGRDNFKKPDTENEILINLPVYDKEKVLSKHFLGKVLEHSQLSDSKVSVNLVKHDVPLNNFQQQRQIINLFSSPQQCCLTEVWLRNYRYFAMSGLFEDLTGKLREWSQAKNIYPKAMEAVTVNDRVYGLPFHGLLTGLTYRKDVFQQLDILPRESVSTIDNFVRTLEKLANKSPCRFSLWAVSVACLLMHLMKGYFDDLKQQFAQENYNPVDKSTGLELLKIISKCAHEYKVATLETRRNEPKEFVRNFRDGYYAMAIDSLNRKGLNFTAPTGEPFELVDFIPFSFSKKGRPFSFLTGTVWTINASLSDWQKEFTWNLLKDYIQPITDYELDRRHLEEGQINSRNNIFIEKNVPRIPDDPGYYPKERQLYDYAESEICFPCPSFDIFVEAAVRIFLNSELNIEKEYDFYRHKLDYEIEKVSPGIFPGC